MVRGYHVVFSAYGFWLPNDPRGSWSDFAGAWELFRLGKATKTDARHSLTNRPHDRNLRLQAKEALQRPAVHFSGEQASAIGLGFKSSVERGGVTVWACAILPEHVRMVIARHTCKVETVVNLLKGAATQSLRSAGLHPFGHQQTPQGKVPTCWGAKCWKVFLTTDSDILRAIKYVENNPLREGKPLQRWSMVRAFVPSEQYAPA